MSQMLIDRRELLARIGMLLGASALPASAVFDADAAEKTRRFLGRDPYALLVAVADTVIPRTDTPGAVQAGIPALLDALLTNWAAPRTREQLQSALQRIDERARTTSGKGFAQLGAQQRESVLREHDRAALQPAPRSDAAVGIEAFLAGPAVVDGGYSRLKELIVNLYYSSRIGLTQELTYVHAPGKWQPSVPVTPDTRPAGGGGAF